MKKVFIMSNDSAFVKNIGLTLDKSKYMAFEQKCSVEQLFSFCTRTTIDILIVDSGFLNGNIQVLHQILTAKRCIIIYATKLSEVGMLYSVLDNPRFYRLPERAYHAINEILEIIQRDTQIIDLKEQEISRYREKIEEDRFVRKAKGYLIQVLGYTEEEAHKLILKKSMNLRMSKLNVAKKILEGVIM